MKTTNILLGVLCCLVAVLCFITGYVHRRWEQERYVHPTGYMEGHQHDKSQTAGD